MAPKLANYTSGIISIWSVYSPVGNSSGQLLNLEVISKAGRGEMIRVNVARISIQGDTAALLQDCD